MMEAKTFTKVFNRFLMDEEQRQTLGIITDIGPHIPAIVVDDGHIVVDDAHIVVD